MTTILLTSPQTPEAVLHQDFPIWFTLRHDLLELHLYRPLRHGPGEYHLLIRSPEYGVTVASGPVALTPHSSGGTLMEYEPPTSEFQAVNPLIQCPAQWLKRLSPLPTLPDPGRIVLLERAAASGTQLLALDPAYYARKWRHLRLQAQARYRHFATPGTVFTVNVTVNGITLPPPFTTQSANRHHVFAASTSGQVYKFHHDVLLGATLCLP